MRRVTGGGATGSRRGVAVSCRWAAARRWAQRRGRRERRWRRATGGPTTCRGLRWGRVSSTGRIPATAQHPTMHPPHGRLRVGRASFGIGGKYSHVEDVGGDAQRWELRLRCRRRRLRLGWRRRFHMAGARAFVATTYWPPRLCKAMM